MENNTRRIFIKQTALTAAGIAFLPSLFSCTDEQTQFDFKISLAEWSLHKDLFAGKISNLDFPVIAKNTYGIDAVEYVNQFFKDKATDTAYLNQLKQRCADNGVQSVLIMVDQEGLLADKNKVERSQAVEKHYKWIDASKYLGGHAIRVNLHGDANAEEWHVAAVESLTKLANYAAKINMSVLAENHGTWSSNGAMLARVVKEVNMKNCGTMVDFANFCVHREKGDLWESPCVEWYDKYKGVEELLPYAKGVSAKTFDFNVQGDESETDFKRMLSLVKASSYRGYVGIEYEGDRLTADEGIRASKKLLEKIRMELAK
jgi:sugar phosphate isomerase/epimerase